MINATKQIMFYSEQYFLKDAEFHDDNKIIEMAVSSNRDYWQNGTNSCQR
jgi:hypothetical protein